MKRLVGFEALPAFPATDDFFRIGWWVGYPVFRFRRLMIAKKCPWNDNKGMFGKYLIIVKKRKGVA